MFDIGIGHKNAIRAPKEGNRWFRASVEQANSNGDYIINIGTGYFRPNANDELDIAMFNQYIREEYSRARKIITKANKMREAFSGKIRER